MNSIFALIYNVDEKLNDRLFTLTNKEISSSTHGRKIQGVEAPKVIAYPPTDNSACSNLLFKVVLSIYKEHEWRHQSDF